MRVVTNAGFFARPVNAAVAYPRNRLASPPSPATTTCRPPQHAVHLLPGAWSIILMGLAVLVMAAGAMPWPVRSRESKDADFS